MVLLAVAKDPSARVSEIAEATRITERYAYQLLSDLQKAGYVRRRRDGRRNHYELKPELALGDPVIGAQPLGQLLTLIRRSNPQLSSPAPPLTPPEPA
jgi:DNA-binding IclR family transcriptional regulator